MENSERICGLLGLATRAGKVTFGTEACMSSIEKKKVNLLLIASDASERTKLKFENICSKYHVPVLEILTEEEISKAIGKENKVVAGVEEVNFSKEILKINNGGEVIG